MDKKMHAAIACSECGKPVNIGFDPEWLIGVYVECDDKLCDGRTLVRGGEALGHKAILGPYPDMTVLH